MWCIILTITTVGYGDFFPQTAGGRIIVFLLCLWGVCMVAFMVTTVSNELAFSDAEHHSYTILSRLQKREEVKEQAALVIGLCTKLMLYGRRGTAPAMLAALHARYVKAKIQFR
mmetsp:Transcript_12425/g.6181  ORF Transcript_12425/g.6181 Transcript_12425/m.6181 type:complete len:114 (+) Transcript_12425:2-343(+)